MEHLWRPACVSLFGIALTAVFALPACGGDDSDNGWGNGGATGRPPGTEGGPCYGNGTCNAGLTCLSKLCVNAAGTDGGDASAAGHGGSPDGGGGAAGEAGSDGGAGASGTSDSGAAGNGGAPDACTPTPELCNDWDDDCDGIADEGEDGKPLQADCSNLCGKGTVVCVNGMLVNCSAPEPTLEVCDGLDNDCDGAIDEDYGCALGATEQCGSDVGKCEYGVHTCGNDCKWGACEGGVSASTKETCDGVVDDDCDGTVDNGCNCTDGDKQDCCGGTQVTCADGAWPTCPTTPKETCNDLDDDCNGKIDDALPVAPFMAEEDVTMKDACDLAQNPPVGAMVTGGSSWDGYLYKADGSADSDWFKFTTDEPSGFCMPQSDQCHTLTFTLTEPIGKDYELCVYYDEVGPVSCGGGTKVCSTDAGQTKNKVVVSYDGVCGLEDGIDFFLEVKPVTAGTTSCKQYSISVDWAISSAVCP